MASAFLLFMDPDRYTVVDTRAEGVLAREGYIPSLPDDPSVEVYVNYLDVCRELADEYDVELRTLDRGCGSSVAHCKAAMGRGTRRPSPGESERRSRPLDRPSRPDW